MFYDYEIKQKNKEEVLYLYLDINQEFAKLNARKKKKKLKENIEEYIRKNKIVFQGTTVAILVSGMIVGTLTLQEPKKNESENVFNTYTISTLLESEPVKEEIVEEKIVKQETVKKETISSATKTVSKESKNNVKEEKSVEKEKKQEEETIQVKIYRSNGTVLNLGLEEYVVGVVSAEMPAAFPIEALKAQAILARTYALRSLEKTTRLTDNSGTQNYKSEEELKKMWGSSFATYLNKIKKAVEETKGIYLTYQGEIIDAVYHSTSNGKTEDAQNVWGNSVPYLVSVESPYDKESSTYEQEKTLSYEELSKKLGFTVNTNTLFEIQETTEGNRVAELLIDSQVYTGVEFRTLLGLRSATFEIEKLENGITITTVGFGHGVGMSQYGANGIAKQGSNYEQILKHYYKGVTLSHK